MMNWILASGSPRRRKLLSTILSDFQVILPEVEELAYLRGDPEGLVETNAITKAEHVARDYGNSVVLGADTTVSLGEHIFGKPADLAEARDFLRELSGRTHWVHTAVAILHEGRNHVFVERSGVTFKKLTEKAIEDYCQQTEPLDKAGGYGIQDSGDLIIKSYAGSYNNIMGLPTESLSEHLKQMGLLTP